MGCLSCHSSVNCARPEHPLPTDFYFVPVLSTWSQPTQLCNQPPWAKWLTPNPRAATQRYRHSSWMTAVQRLPCAAKSVPSLSVQTLYSGLQRDLNGFMMQKAEGSHPLFMWLRTKSILSAQLSSAVKTPHIFFSWACGWPTAARGLEQLLRRVYFLIGLGVRKTCRFKAAL